MKIYKVYFIIGIMAIVMVACGPSKDEKAGKIDQLEQELFSDQKSGVNKEKAIQLTEAYIEYADLFPEDSVTPDYLFRAADMSMNIFSSGKAIDLYNRIIRDYPDYKKAPQCVFLKAFVYENNLGDLNSAKKYYEEFLAKYPDDDFADDAKMSLQNLGKSPEELIKEFEEKMKAQDQGEE